MEYNSYDYKGKENSEREKTVSNNLYENMLESRWGHNEEFPYKWKFVITGVRYNRTLLYFLLYIKECFEKRILQILFDFLCDFFFGILFCIFLY